MSLKRQLLKDVHLHAVLAESEKSCKLLHFDTKSKNLQEKHFPMSIFGRHLDQIGQTKRGQIFNLYFQAK